MKISLLFFVFALFFLSASAQKIAKVDHEYQADFTAYSVDYEYQADLVVYVTDKDYRARKEDNKGVWFFVNPSSAYRADKKVFFTDRPYRADLKVFFTDKEYRAGWKDASKKPLLY